MPTPSPWKRLQHAWNDSRWTIIGLLWLLTTLLGIIGFRQYYLYNDNPQPALNYWYKTLQLFTIESGSVEGFVPWPLEIARWLAPAIAAYTALAALAILFNEQFQLLRLRRFRGHVIICGLGRKGYLLAQGFLRRGDRVVAIEKDAENDYIEACRELGALVLSGDAAKPEMLERCGVRQARYLVAVNGEDSTNAEIAVLGKRLIGRSSSRRGGEPLTCLVHIQEPRLCELLHQQEIAASSDGQFRLEFFNVFDMGARAVLEQYPPFPRDGEQVQPHILLIGLGGMGQSLLVRASRQWRERQRRLNPESPRPLHVTVIDRMASYKAENLALRFPRLSAVCSLHLHQVDIQWPEFQRGEFLEPQDGIPPVSIVYVCLDNDSLGLSASLTLQQKLRSLAQAGMAGSLPQAVNVVLRTSNEVGIGGLLGSETAQDGARIHAFGLLEQTCQPGLLLGGSHEILARALYEDYCLIQQNLKDPNRNAGDLPPWEALPETEREKNRRQGDRLGTTLKAAGYGIQPLTDWDAETLPLPAEDATRMGRIEHGRYVEEMLANGWTLGPRDPKKKTNPNLLAWESLPEDIKELNRATFYPVPRLLAEAGLELYRLNSKEANHGE
jgi:hypothetical protein